MTCDIPLNKQLQGSGIFDAIKSSNHSVLQKILEAITNGVYPFDPYDSDKDWNTPLHLAAIHGNDPNLIEQLLIWGSPPNIKNNTGSTPLHLAVANCTIDTIGQLIQAGGDVNIIDIHGNTVLHLCTDPDILLYLLPWLENINSKHKYGGTILHNLCRSPYFNIAVFSALIEREIDVDIQDICENTALMFAGEFGNAKAFKYLLLNGADMYHKNYKNEDALSLLRMSGVDASIIENICKDYCTQFYSLKRKHEEDENDICEHKVPRSDIL